MPGMVNKLTRSMGQGMTSTLAMKSLKQNTTPPAAATKPAMRGRGFEPLVRNHAQADCVASTDTLAPRFGDDLSQLPVTPPPASSNPIAPPSSSDEWAPELGELGASAVDLSELVPRSTYQPLDEGTRAWMASGFGRDFSHVRVHADRAGGDAAAALSADAFTTGRDIFFAYHRYQPHTASGQQLIAHEVAHTIQQSHHLAPPPTPCAGAAKGR